MTEERKIQIRDNFLRVREKIENAVARRGAGPEVTLLAATKTVPAEEILFAREELGLKVAGENRTAELLSKYDVLGGKIPLHIIGTLQTRKVRDIIGKVCMIESVDSVKLAEEINKRSAAAGIVTDVLVEVNIGREAAKGGVMPEDVADLLDKMADLKSISPRGIMTMAPFSVEEYEQRKFFYETYQIFIDIYTKKVHNVREGILSMGMSDSFEAAILEGATQIRVGSSLFGGRVY